jgi:hypothetical protein
VETGAEVVAVVEDTGFAIAEVTRVVGTADETEAADEAGAEPVPLMVKSMQDS